MHVFKVIAQISMALFLVGCGGGGDCNTTLGLAVNCTKSPSNLAPVARAGVAQNVVTGATVVLDGSASLDANGDQLSYTWTLLSQPEGSSAVISSADTVRPTFVADKTGVYVVSLKASDGSLSSEAAVVTITASVLNLAPVANAGNDQNVVTQSLVTLDASASSDANRDAITYAWSLISKPSSSRAELAGSSTAKPSFTADLDGAYVAGLTVSDGRLSSSTVYVRVTASAANLAPVADAGSPQNVGLGSQVTLDATNSLDANRDLLGYTWTLISKPAGSSATLTGPTTPKPGFLADKAGDYVFGLTVSDGKLSSAPAFVTVNASDRNVKPVAVAGVDSSVLVGRTVVLDGSASSDANAQDTLTYKWEMKSLPTGSKTTLLTATGVKPSFVPDMIGTYVVGLVVNDGRLDSDMSVVTVTAGTNNLPPVASAGADQSVKLGVSVTLDATASTDPNADPLTYQWTIVYRPPSGSSANLLASSTTPKPVFVPDTVGLYVISLTVSDGTFTSKESFVTVTVTP